MTFANIVRLLATVPVALTVLPLSRTGRGWVRIWDFPRLQITGLALLGSAAMARLTTPKPVDRALRAALGASSLFQIAKVVPYTPFYRRQVPTADNVPADRCIRLLMANVLQENRRADLVLQAIEAADVDVICLVETDQWWADAMRAVEQTHPWGRRYPLENHYGMCLYSRLPIGTCDVRFVVTDDVPSMRARVRLRSGDEVTIHVVHPPPPLPGSPSYGRDAELVITGLEIAKAGDAAIVIGDLNDVAWSYTTTLFQRLSHMVDPRVGRGMFSTFHSGHPLARYPLDHVFHTSQFTVKTLQRLPYTGSDHFPILVELAFTPGKASEVARPEPSRADLDQAREIVSDAETARPYVDAEGRGQVRSRPAGR